MIKPIISDEDLQAIDVCANLFYKYEHETYLDTEFKIALLQLTERAIQCSIFIQLEELSEMNSSCIEGIKG